jgi:hypothetical protein
MVTGWGGPVRRFARGGKDVEAFRPLVRRRWYDYAEPIKGCFTVSPLASTS